MSVLPFDEPGTRDEVERGETLTPRFDDRGLIPAIATDHETGQVLMLAWMNAEALARTIEGGEAVYWSRSRSELWHKGGTSGHVQIVHEIRVDCDQDAIWLRVEQRGPGCCHVGHPSCFYRRVESTDGTARLVTTGDPTYDPTEVYGSK